MFVNLSNDVVVNRKSRVNLLMFVTPEAFFLAATFPGYFPKWKLLKCAFSQAASSQICPSCCALPKPVLAVALGPIAHPSRTAPQRAIT